MDLINRQDAINAVKDVLKKTPAIAIRVMETIKRLPCVQPEIIQCKDCKHWKVNGGKQEHILCEDSTSDYFCADAEK